MNLENRWFLMTAFSALLALAGCDDKKGLSAAGRDSGTPVSNNPDTAEPIASNDAPVDGHTQPVGTAILTVTPPSVDLGYADIGKTSDPVVVMVTNTGDVASGPLSVTVTGDGIRATGCAGTVLAPKAACEISIVAQQMKAGPISGTVEVGDSPANTKRIAVTGFYPSRMGFTLSTNSLDLGSLLPGKSASGTIVITNSAFVDLTGFHFNVDGTGFSLSPTGTCTDTIAMEQTCDIVVTFTAGTTPGPAKGTLQVSQGGVTKTVALTATVMPPTPVNPVDLIPVDDTVSGWMIDPDNNVDGSKKPMTATSMEGGGLLIDGGIEPYYADGFSPKLFIWQNYFNTHLPAAPAGSWDPKGASIMLFVFRMSSAAQAGGLYQNVMKFSQYTRKRLDDTSNGWEEPTSPLIGTKSRIQDTNVDWWINFYKNEYYVEIQLTPSNGPAPDYEPGNLDLKKEALRFAQAVAEKL
jgi:hypothetical protein